MNNSRVFAVISIFQRTLFLLGNAERCGQRSRCFRLKVRGERLKAGSFYRFALNYFYVVRPKGGGRRVLNDNSSQFYSSIIVNFFPFCGLEECAMHIDNPQMKGLFFCGVTRHVCRGYDRLRILGLRSRRACAQVCAHARHANIIYILLRQWLYHQSSIRVCQETDIQLAVIDICAQSRHIQYQHLWLYTR